MSEALNIEALRRRLSSLPNLGALLAPGDAELRTLAQAWHLGATERSEPAPFVEMILGRPHKARLAELEAGLPGLGLSDSERANFRARIAQDKRGAHATGVAALAELMVGVRLEMAGAAVRFVEAGKENGIRTPDIEASRGTIAVTLEVTSFHEADATKVAADADRCAFAAWVPSRPMPGRLIG
jgi:hypothetical protein